MTWFGSRTPWDAITNRPVIDPFYSPPGAPSTALIPKWPEPNTARVNGKIRWLSEPDLYPLATRWYGIVFYDKRVGASAQPIWQHAEYFWIDLDFSDPLTLSGTTDLSPYGTQAAIEFKYTDLGPPLGDGFQATYSISATGEPAVQYVTKNPIQRFQSSLTQSDTGGTVTPSYNTQWLTGSYPFIWMNLFPMATCYPTSSGMKPKDTNMLNGVSLQAVGGINFSTSYLVPWQNPDREVGGTWFDIAQPSPRTQIVVPSPFNLVWLNAQIQFTATIQSAIVAWRRNGGTLNYRPVGSERSCTGNPQNVYLNATSGGWIQCSPGDVFEVVLNFGAGSGQIVQGINSWVNVTGIVG